MRTTFLFAPPAFGPRLGSPMPLRRRSLGFTPTGEPMPTQCTDLGVRMIQDQGGYSPIGCPTGPDCYDIIDAVTGQIVIAKIKGAVPWIEPCAQFGYTNPGGGGSAPPPAGDTLKACDLPGHPGWYYVLTAAGDLATGSPLSKEEVQQMAAGRNIAWTTDCPPLPPGTKLTVPCNVSPNTQAYVDVRTGQKYLEQAGQFPQQHPLCPTTSQQSATPTSPCPEMTVAEFQAADKAQQEAWQASGATIVTGGCAVIVNPDGTKGESGACYFPGPNTEGYSMPEGPIGGSAGGGPVGTPGAAYNAQTGGPGFSSCDDKWKWMCENLGGPNDPWKKYCPGQPGATAPTPTPTPTPTPSAAAPTPAPAPTSAPKPAGEGPVPLSIDIQAFTPGGMGPIPTQPLMQPQPLLAPRAAQPAVQATAQTGTGTEAKLISLAPAPKEPESKPLDTGSAVGLGFVALLAIAAAAFGGGK